jgi:hypothetical protein
MLAWIAYCMGTFTLGILLAFIISLFFLGPTQQVDKPHRIVIYSLIFTMSTPFVYCETLTKLFGDPMEHAVKQAFDDSPIEGTLDYYRLISYNSDHATALVVGSEKQGWGGTDRPVMKVVLSQKDGHWVADSYSIIYSSRLNKDGIVFPPYQ